MIYHKDLEERFKNLSIFEQMANIGAEVGRAINWREKNIELGKKAFYRALELFDFATNDPKNKNSLKEILRAREVFCDYYVGDNLYHSTGEAWNKYFYYFNKAARGAKS
ncbi:hypothetical protein HYU95_01480 [Candidatus Daviesbacteria bacterium]|nr:hypothetical protein [Candidatus Daviesbacteria bacterium]